MDILNYFKTKFLKPQGKPKSSPAVLPSKNYSGAIFPQREQEQLRCSFPPGALHGLTFDGELEPGALNGVYLYDVDYYTLAKRAYTLVATNEFARILVTRLTEFVVGTGLRLHPTPMRGILERLFKISIPDDFAKQIQEIWSLLEDDKNISVTKEQNIHSLAKSVFYNGFIAGDVLVVKRIVNNNLEFQIINGLSIYSGKCYADNGNKIIDGVEIDKNEVPVKYYVENTDGEEVEIPARDNKGRLIAWLVPVGIKRLNQTRAFTQLGSIMQKLHKIGDYSNAEVMAAQINSKIALKVEQDSDSSGVNPIKGIAGLGRSVRADLEKTSENLSLNPEIEKFRHKIERIPSALSFFMPKGQKLDSFDTKRPNTNFTNFLDGSMKYIFASNGIPFEVALMVFSNNFSASRASLKMFEVILEHIRKNTIDDYFYQIVYGQFFELECLKGNIKAPKYLELKNDAGYMDNAYTKAKFVGSKIPHIDEVKEVNAVLSKLKGGLTTFEQALETLGVAADFDTLIERRRAEENKIKKAGLNFETLFAPDNGASNDDDTESDLKIKRK